MSEAPLKSFGAYAFAECVNLSTIILPKVLEVVPQYAFYCSGASGFSYRSNYSIINSYYNNSCTKIVIPNTVKRIEKYAFANFSNLTSVDFGTSVEYIEDYAFYFKTFYGYDIPYTSYYQCGEYEWCSMELTKEDCVFDNKLTTLKFPNSLKSIGECAFANHAKLTTIDFGKSLTEIGNYAFSGYGYSNEDSYESDYSTYFFFKY